MTEDRFRDVDGLRIRYRQVGAIGPDIVPVHGIATRRHRRDALAAAGVAA
ncbi:MAG: hypothetical protein QE484_11465 [Rhizobium sp.]|nr:hypothetical protein [Rhizobium sp.]